MILSKAPFVISGHSRVNIWWGEGTFGTALESQFGASGCSQSPPVHEVSLQSSLPVWAAPVNLSNPFLSKGNSLGNSIWNQYYIFFINLWSVYVLISVAERSMSYKEDSTNCSSESSVLGWQRKVLLSEHFKRADFHFCKSWCFKNLCQTIQSTKNYSLEEKTEYVMFKNILLFWTFP